MWNHCQKDWNLAVSSTKWKPKFITTLSIVEDADDPNVCCIQTRASDIAMLVDLGDLDALKEISYHAISNAFTPLDF